MTGGHDAFSLLGVSPEDQLTDDDVRAAWRRIAEATHPDRADGGDPERFAAAAAAYTELRTRYGRNEARAALAEPGRESRRAGRARAGIGARITGGRPARLALRAAAAAVAATLGLLAAGGGPAGPALAAGAATWLVLTARHDLGPP
jgi:curved DNA-binding protein CbpA